MSLMDDFNNMVFFLKNKTRTSELKKECTQKYNKIYKIFEKLFDKIYEKDCTPSDITIIQKMITMKIQKDNGFIDKLNADKAIGETLCDIYVKPMLNEKNKDKK